MKSSYKKAIIVGLAALIVIIMLNSYASYRADQDMKEYYKELRAYDNDFVGVGWALMAFLGILIISILAGAFAAIWGINDIRNPVEALKVSAVAFAMPGLIILIYLIILGALAGTYGPSPQLTVDSLRSGFTSGIFLLGLVFFMVCICGSAISGLFCYLLFSNRNAGVHGAQLLNRTSAVKAGSAGAIVTLAIYAIAFFLSDGKNSYIVLFDEFFIFTIVSALAGILSVALGHESRFTRSGVVTSLVAGAIVGLGGISGRLFFSAYTGKTSMSVLFTDGPGFFADGMVFAVLGALLIIALSSRENRPDARAVPGFVYANAIATGACFGFVWLALQIIIPSIQWPFLLLMYLATVIIAGALSAGLSNALTARDAAAVSGVAGGIGCIVLTMGDLLYVFLSRTDNALISAPLSEEIHATNMLSTLGWASVKIAFIMSLVCWAGIVYVSVFKKTEGQRTGG